MDCSPPGSSVHRILQARILECFAIPFSRGSSRRREQTWVSRTAGRSFTVRATGEALFYIGDFSIVNEAGVFMEFPCFHYDPMNAGHLMFGSSTLGFPSGSEVKASAWNAGDLGSIPGSGRSPGEGNGNPLQYSCLENPMEGGA